MLAFADACATDIDTREPTRVHIANNGNPNVSSGSPSTLAATPSTRTQRSLAPDHDHSPSSESAPLPSASRSPPLPSRLKTLSPSLSIDYARFPSSDTGSSRSVEHFPRTPHRRQGPSPELGSFGERALRPSQAQAEQQERPTSQSTGHNDEVSAAVDLGVGTKRSAHTLFPDPDGSTAGAGLLSQVAAQSKRRQTLVVNLDSSSAPSTPQSKRLQDFDLFDSSKAIPLDSSSGSNPPRCKCPRDSDLLDSSTPIWLGCSSSSPPSTPPTPPILKDEDSLPSLRPGVHSRCAGGMNPCIAYGTFTCVAPSFASDSLVPNTVYSDQRFRDGEATPAQVRYILSRCDCSNADFFEAVWQRWMEVTQSKGLPSPPFSREKFFAEFCGDLLNGVVEHCPERPCGVVYGPGSSSHCPMEIEDC